ncbi:hypothetical protein PG984_013017 [Apiospora sp. TS-2023a]
MRSQQLQLLRRPWWRWPVATAAMPMAATMMVLLSMPTAAHARVHHLFAANRSPPPRLYALAFDDDGDDGAGAIAVTAQLAADTTHARLALDAARDNVYGVSLDKAAVASYEVVVTNTTTNNVEEEVGEDGVVDGMGRTKTTETTNVTLAFRKSVVAAGACVNRTAAFVLPHPRFARVYTASWRGADAGACGMALSTTTTDTSTNNDSSSSILPAAANDGNGKGKGKGGGVLEEVVQSWRYDERYVSGRIAGMALDPMGFTIYSADLDGGGAVGAFGFAGWDGADQDSGGAQRQGQQRRPPQGPRHLVVHPNGRVLYVVMETANAVAAYRLDGATGLPVAEISRRSLLPEGVDPAQYRGAEVVLSLPSSPDGDTMPKYLWAAAAGDNSTEGGFISVFGLDRETGNIEEQPLFRAATTMRTNAIAPAPWSEDWAAVADAGTGSVEIWHIEETTTQNDDNVTATATMKSVARVNLPEAGCCGNVIWYD